MEQREKERESLRVTKGSSSLSSSFICWFVFFVFLLVVGVSLFLDGLSSPSVCVQSRDTQAEQPEDRHAHGTPPTAPYSSYL